MAMTLNVKRAGVISGLRKVVGWVATETIIALLKVMMWLSGWFGGYFIVKFWMMTRGG